MNFDYSIFAIFSCLTYTITFIALVVTSSSILPKDINYIFLPFPKVMKSFSASSLINIIPILYNIFSIVVPISDIYRLVTIHYLKLVHIFIFSRSFLFTSPLSYNINQICYSNFILLITHS